MSRLLPVAALAALAAAALVVVGVLASTAPATDAERVEHLAAQLRCPDCEALSVAESRTRAADGIRHEISELVAAGRSDQAVRDHFVERYGQWILLAPADPLAWWLPVLVVLAAVVAFGAWLLHGRSAVTRGGGAPPTGAAGAPATPHDGDARRVREELEAMDG
jgi:cytochrome c-type biogenesis protein CcmH